MQQLRPRAGKLGLGKPFLSRHSYPHPWHILLQASPIAVIDVATDVHAAYSCDTGSPNARIRPLCLFLLLVDENSSGQGEWPLAGGHRAGEGER